MLWPAPPLSFSSAKRRRRLEGRGVLELTGKDGVVEKFLQGLTTNDMGLLASPDQPSMYTFFLSNQGRVLFDAFVNQAGDAADERNLVDCDAALLPALCKHLRKCRLRTKIGITDVSADHAVTVYPSGADASGFGGADPRIAATGCADPALQIGRAVVSAASGAGLADGTEGWSECVRGVCTQHVPPLLWRRVPRFPRSPGMRARPEGVARWATRPCRAFGCLSPLLTFPHVLPCHLGTARTPQRRCPPAPPTRARTVPGRGGKRRPRPAPGGERVWARATTATTATTAATTTAVTTAGRQRRSRQRRRIAVTVTGAAGRPQRHAGRHVGHRRGVFV